jgi:hypothetical protein
MNWFQKAFGGLFNGGFNSFGWNSVRFMSPNAKFNNYNTDKLKLQAVFTHPAVLKVFALNMDIASLGNIYVYDNNDKEIKDDAFLERFERPNPFQTKQQFLSDYVLWNMIGNSYLYTVNRGVDSDYTKQYFLDPSKMEWNKKIENDCDKMILSKTEESEIYNQEITYRYNDGSKVKIKLKDISIFSDLSNGVGNWFKSPSRLETLYKVISNSEASLDSANVNIRYAGKFIVAGKHNPENVSDTPMGSDEVQSIDSSMNKEGKIVYPVKSMIDVKRFVENIANLKLEESYMNAYYIIGSMYGIPRDLLEAYLKDGSKFNNQSVALQKHITYTIQPKMDSLANDRTKKFKLNEQGKRLVISYDHLPVMQANEKETAEVKRLKAETMESLQRAGVSQEEINAFLDINFKNVKPIKSDEQRLQTGQE